MVVFADGTTAGAYLAEVDGWEATFSVVQQPDGPLFFRDEETGTLWDLGGRAVEVRWRAAGWS